MKLAVCGCSWSSVDSEHKGIEFGSLISSHLNAEYYNLAKPGCSNFGIALQVDYALKHYDPDVFIIKYLVLYHLINLNKEIRFSLI